MSAKQRGFWRRWGIFNLVGILGFVVQLSMLFLLRRLFRFDLVIATAIAVEIAVLHNFTWHEHVTWADFVSPLQHGVLGRLLRFHLANGLISIAGNVAITWLLVQWVHLPYLLANAVSVLVCSIVNFFAGDRFVFRRKAAGHRSRRRSICRAL
jgi:putative flippase GtrA